MFGAEPAAHGVAQLLGVHFGGVDTVGFFAQGGEGLPLLAQAFGEGLVEGGERVAAAGFGEAAHEGGFVCFEKEDFGLMALSGEIGKLFFDFAHFDAGADVDADGEVFDAAAADVVQHELGQYFHRHVVDAVVARVFELFEGDGFAGAGKAANQDDLHAACPALS